MSHDRFRYGLIGVGFIVAVVLFIRLPAIGRFGPSIDRWTWPWLSTSFTLPLAALAIVLIFRSLAKRDPFRANYVKFRPAYNLFLDFAVLLTFVTHVLILSKIMILQGRVGQWISYVPTTLIGLLLVVFGNVLPRLRPNSVIGVRTRWTLGDEIVWMKAHRAGGYFLVVFGLTLIVWTFVDFMGIWWVLGPGTILTIVGLPAASYFIWKHRHPSAGTARATAEDNKETRS